MCVCDSKADVDIDRHLSNIVCWFVYVVLGKMFSYALVILCKQGGDVCCMSGDYDV